MNVTGGRKIPYHTVHGNVSFRDVTFSYPSRPEHVMSSLLELKRDSIKFIATYVITFQSISNC